ncbi:MAG: SDR family oxidoreductase [Chloroflexota bacterium]|nr:SDR family oxidoreductase [Chloroflexota bacterium]
MPEQGGEFAGRKVAIIGGGSELEQATARAFTDSGGQVARTQEDTGDGDGGVDRVVEWLGGLDVAIRFATTRSREPAITADPAVWRRDVDRVLTGAFIDAQTAAREMSRRGGGSIVLVGSVDATHAYPGRSAAAAAVSGLMGLTRALAVEFAPLGIRVNLVIPGPLLDEEARDMAVREPQRLEQVRRRSPAHRLASPLEVTAAILFVAGTRASFMTGQALPVDGGWTSLNQASQLLAHP